ncbi:farnesyl cysteine carboxyl-methyltransferase [Edaphobacter acidisoli]|uniref:Farnesyl cysteine carboxyl-methyltransferase n=2 Tax=Edaphobacter acidisoli TaxID=2040573 RepID=A0A916RU31_9BACT|nr:farnesyl cysteine carboxyl-methyltransferase [Edaphobacter acidisoli]
MPVYVCAILALGWALWFAPFLRKWNQRAAKKSDSRSRWGMLLEFIAYALLWMRHSWSYHPALWRIFVSVALFAVGALLSWAATNALGIHLRFEAAISDGHKLIRTGPYALVRHPIYASMLAVLLATGIVVTPWRLFVVALVVFLIGTEIRVQTEDNLLANHFGSEFSEYRKSVPAYIPLVR